MACISAEPVHSPFPLLTTQISVCFVRHSMLVPTRAAQEVLLAIKLVKFYVWEDCFAERVSEVGGW